MRVATCLYFNGYKTNVWGELTCAQRLTPTGWVLRALQGDSTKVRVNSGQPCSMMSSSLLFPCSLLYQCAPFLLSASFIWHPSYFPLSPHISRPFFSAFLCHSTTSQMCPNFYMEMCVLLGMQCVSSKNYLEVKCSSATTKFYTFQNVRISR